MENNFPSDPISLEKRGSGESALLFKEAIKHLEPGSQERVAPRHVQLTLGSLVLCEADSWFVFDRLSPQARRLLLCSDLPFGAATCDLHTTRDTYFVRLASVPAGCGISLDDYLANLSPTATVLEHRSLFLDRLKRPVAVMSERYLAALLRKPEGPP